MNRGWGVGVTPAQRGPPPAGRGHGATLDYFYWASEALNTGRGGGAGCGQDRGGQIQLLVGPRRGGPGPSPLPGARSCDPPPPASAAPAPRETGRDGMERGEGGRTLVWWQRGRGGGTGPKASLSGCSRTRLRRPRGNPRSARGSAAREGPGWGRIQRHPQRWGGCIQHHP